MTLHLLTSNLGTLPTSKLDLPNAALKLAEEGNFELAGYKFDVLEEQLRKPRIVRVGAVQNKIVQPTSAPIAKQVCDYHYKIKLSEL